MLSNCRLVVPASVAIDFDTGEYRRSHMHEPRGRGSWAFAAHPDADVTSETLWTPSMTYGEAKAYVKRMLRGKSSDDDVIANPTLWANNCAIIRKGFSMRGSRVYIYVLS